jgi:predicted permease
MNTLRYTWRSLAKSPGFAAVSILALGLGLGMSSTMFAVLDAVLHPYVAYRDPETLFSVHWWFGRRNPMRPPELYRFLRDETHSFAAVLSVERAQLVLQAPGGEEEIFVTRVPPRYFLVTGVTVERGRSFTEADGDNVAVLSAGLWRHLFGKRRSLQGAVVTLGDRIYPVVGVMPRGAPGPSAWLPQPASIETDNVSAGYVQPFVRLKQGVTREQAAAELKTLARLLTDRFGAQDAPFGFELVPLVWPREALRDIHKAMVGSALAVLLIACVNLAHLMLARGLAKRRELALRMALGASRAAVIRQMFAECAVITLGGAVLGGFVTLWGADLLQNRMPPEVAWIGLVRPQLSWRVFALATLAAAASAVLFGLVPAVRVALDVNVTEPLKDDSGTTTGRVRQRYSPLVVSEVALALVLMMGGGLLLRTVRQLQRDQLSFETRTLYRGALFRRSADSRTRQPVGAHRRADILAVARGVEGVADAAYSSYHRVGGGAITAELAEDSTRVITTDGYWSVTPNYVRVLGLPILRGRDFEDGDAAGSGVAIVDPIAAKRLYPNLADPVGKMIKLGGPMSNGRWIPIVGLMRSPSILESRDRDAAGPTVLVAEDDSAPSGSLILRTRSVESRAPSLLPSRLKTATGVSAYFFPYDYERQAELASRGFLAKVFVGMGAVALGLAVLGLYAVLAYAVSRRMREFAVRLALGADPRGLLRLVLHDGLVMLLAGIGLGAFVALAAARLLDAVLIAVLPSDVTSLVLCELILLVIGLAAALGPARRAMRADPMAILRAV